MNKPEWYGLEWTEKLAQAYEKFFEFNLRLWLAGIKLHTQNLNEMIHAV